MTRNLKKIAVFFMAFLLVVGTLPFVGLKTVNAADDYSTDTNKITIGTVKNTPAMLPVEAKATTDFTRNNISVDVKTFDSNSELNDAISNGTVNAAVSNLVSYASIAKDNSSWKIAGTLPGYHGLVANKKYKSVKSLKGKTIAVDKKDSSYQYLKDLLKKKKVKLSKVKIKQIDSNNDRVDSLKSGDIDAAVLEDPAISMAKANGGKILNRQKRSADNGDILIIDKKFASKNTSATQILVDVLNQQIKTINKLGNYTMANDALREFGVTGEAAKMMNNMDFKFKKIHKVKKSNFNKAFKYAKKQKLYSGKYKYKSDTIKIKGVK